MAHELTTRKNGQTEMAYVGNKPWHGLGQELKPGATIQEWVKAAGMDWRILRSQVRYATAHGMDSLGSFRTWPERHVLMRSDTFDPLGMVSDEYKVVQPIEVLEFFRDLTELAGFQLETAGTLRGGKQFWAMANTKAQDTVAIGDRVNCRLMFASSCDGSMNSIVKNIAECVVCANTLAIAMNERGNKQVAVSHRSRFDSEAVKKELGIAVDSFTKFMHGAKMLAKRDVSKKEVNQFFADVLQIEDVKEAEEDKAFKSFMALFSGAGRGALNPGRRGTAWGALNAVTEHVDHHARARSVDNRISSAWFGRGDDLKQRAHAIALELVK